MSFRKRRRPTPNFGIPPPYSPVTGDHADLRTYGVFPYCAMMQVAEEDKYVDYVICRGFDPRIQKFVDYEEGNDDKPGISVAKPFGSRVKCYYQVGQVFPAVLPTQGTVYEGRPGTQDYVPPSPTEVDWRVGQNPGTTLESCGGQPQELSDAITEMTDHNGKYVNWMLISGDIHGKEVLVYNAGVGPSAYTVEQFNAIGITWSGEGSATVDTETYAIWGLYPYYSVWGIAQQDIAPGECGRVVIHGLTLARVYKRTYAAISAGSRFDIDPEWLTYSGADLTKRQRLHSRLHGIGRVIEATTGLDDDYELALAYIEDQPPEFAVILKDTTPPAYVSGGVNQPSVYPVAGTSTVDSDDELTMNCITSQRSYVAGIGVDDTSCQAATRGRVKYNRYSKLFELTEWPTSFAVRFQSAVDQLPIAANGCSLKFCYGSSSNQWTDAGDTFTEGVGRVDDVTTVSNINYTINAPYNTIATLNVPDGRDQPYIDPATLVDAPYGVVRMFSGVTITGDGPCIGWHWCDGTDGAPDLRDRFIIGARASVGGGNAIDTTGGQSTHGNGTNDHDDHGTVEVQSGSGQTVARNDTHSSTDNQPPWYAVAFAIRQAG